MKKIMSLLVAVVFFCAVSYAQKKPLDHSVYDSWQSVAGTVLTPDGAFMGYNINVQEGDALLVVRRNADGREVRIERGGDLRLDPAGKWAYCTIKPEFQATRQARIDKKKSDDMPKDSIAVINLKDLSVRKFANGNSVSSGHDAMPFLAYKFDKGVVVLDPATGDADTLRSASQFAFNRTGDILSVVYKKDKKDSLSRNEAALYFPAARSSVSLAEGAQFYSLPVFDIPGKRVTFLASADSVADGNKHCALWLYENGTSREIVPQSFEDEYGWTLNENSAPYFSHSGGRIFVGIAPFRPAKDTTIIDFETAKLDIWNWDSYLTPPQQKIQQQQILRKTYLSVVDLSSVAPKPLLLTDSDFGRLTLIDGGDSDWALSVDSTPYMISSTWDGNDFTDVDLVSLKDGSRREVARALPGRARISPEGKYLYWFSSEDCEWYTYNFETDETVCLTENCDTPFYDEDDDHPMAPGPYDNSPLWVDGDRYVVIADRYDLFKFAADGSSVENITKGAGRRERVQFRKALPVDWGFTSAERSLGIGHEYTSGETYFFTAFDEVSKRNGYGKLSGLKPQEPAYFLAESSFLAFAKARDAATAVFTKGDFRHSHDLYLTREVSRRPSADFKGSAEAVFSSAQKLTSINPQQDQYSWGDARLVHWTAYDGTPLDGILFVPEGTTEEDKLPMIIYFYEKYSETLYDYRAPAPSRSTVNIPYYVSNGYVAFIPDIVYEIGHPGESAYNCIVSGAEAMCDQFGFIDRDRMGIQGQSWGGYQTAYLVTRTNLFAAAGSGAPVGNMTSAYGGIRWESGNVRAVQYEHGQSRIGKSMWEPGGLDLYIENSPVFHVDKVETPVLIMHNDADGAVPWYQGIEFFMNLRRFEKPAWLLEYNDEAHNLRERRNCKDLTVRLQQFFDHYLKDAPMPAWMSDGVPYWRKGQYFGFENAE